MRRAVALRIWSRGDAHVLGLRNRERPGSTSSRWAQGKRKTSGLNDMVGVVEIATRDGSPERAPIGGTQAHDHRARRPPEAETELGRSLVGCRYHGAASPAMPPPDGAQKVLHQVVPRFNPRRERGDGC